MKAAASLTGSLLARKGAAYPASYSAPNASPQTPAGAEGSHNSADVVRSGMPLAPHTSDQGPQMQDGRFVEEMKDAKAAPAPMAAAPVAAAPAPGSAASPDVEEPGLPQVMDKMGRVRLSVRLDPDRYLRVKMASARTRWSAQDIVIAALDRYLDGSASKSAGNDEDDYDDEDLN